MSDQPINIQITDKVAPTIVTKIRDIAVAAEDADSKVEKLKAQLKIIDTSALARVAAATNTASAAFARNQTAVVKLATANQNLATAEARTAAAVAKVTTAQNQAESSTLRLAAAKGRLGTESLSAGEAIMSLTERLAAFIGVGLGIEAIEKAADAYTNLQNKLKNVSESGAQTEEITNRLFQIANKVGTPVQDVASAFVRFDMALKNLGASQNESLRLTETIDKALIVSGANAEESAAGLLQLSQAFNKGKLDGDEFRSVMELIPTAADAIAKQLKVTRGDLLTLAPQGKITAQVMREAFAALAEQVDKTVGKITPTFGRALQNLRNSSVQFFGEIEKATGILTGFSTVILFVANHLKLMATAVATLGALMLAAFAPAILTGIAAGFTAIGATLATFGELLLANPLGLFIAVVASAALAIYAFRQNILDALESVKLFGMNGIELMLSFADTVRGVFYGIVNVAKVSMQDFANYFQAPINYIKSIFGSISDAVLDVFNTVVSYAQSLVDKIKTHISDLLSYVNQYLPQALQVSIDFVSKNTPDAIKKVGAVIGKSFSDGFAQAQKGGLLEQYRNGTLFGKDTATPSSLRPAGVGTPNTIQKKAKKVPETAEEKYENMRAFTLDKINNELDNQLALTQQIGFAGQVEAEMTKINNELYDKKIVLETSEAEAIRKKVVQIEYNKGVQTELNKIYSDTQGKQLSLTQQVTALNEAYQKGLITLDDYKNRLVKVGVEAANLKVKMGTAGIQDFATASLGRLIENYQGVAAGLTDSFGSFFQSFTDGFANSIGHAIAYGEDLKSALQDVARSAIAELISSLIKLGIQWVVNAALGDALAASSAASQVAIAGTTGAAIATAYAPAAAFASLASFGANAALASAGILLTNAVAQKLAHIPGFESGGYTGNVGTSSVAGVVHGQEFVFDAAATQRIGVGNLEAMRSNTASYAPANTNSGSGPVKVNIVNKISDAEYSAQQLSSGDVEIIARRIVRQDAPGVVANDLGAANGRTSKALSKNTNTQRKRT